MSICKLLRDAPRRSLRDADMISTSAARGGVALRDAVTDASAVERRTVLRVAAAAVATAATFALGTRPAHAITDSDQGRNADPPNRGRGTGGITDSDAGPYGDPPRHGTGAPPRPVHSDGSIDRERLRSDEERAAASQGYTGLNDQDPGDPPGHGSPGRNRGSPRAGCSDSDPGDPAFGGRHCR